MNPMLIVLGLSGAGLAYVLKSKKTSATSQVAPASPGVYVSTPLPRPHTVSQSQHHGHAKPKQQHSTVTVQASGGMSAQVPVAATNTNVGVVYSPPNAIQPGQPVPTVSTSTGSAPIGILSVKDVQQALNTLGYQPKLVEDNKFGPKTAANIRQYQKANGLVVDGNASPTVKAALSASLIAMAAGPRIQIAQQVANVTPAQAPPLSAKDVQHYLNMLGANPQLVEDGKVGPKTVAAIKSFQVSHGLTPDGIAGPKTKAALAIALQNQ